MAISLGRAASRAADPRLFLLTGTPTNYSDESFPSKLYEIGTQQKLHFVREIVARKDGIYSVRAVDGALFVASPHITPTTISVVREEDPEVAHVIQFNSDGLFVNDSHTWTAELKPSTVSELFPLENLKVRTAHSLATVSATLHSAPHVEAAYDDWRHLGELRRDGIAGGPYLDFDLVGSFAGNEIGITAAEHFVPVDTLSEMVMGRVRGRVPIIVASSGRYLAFLLQWTNQELASSQLPTQTPIYVHDRQQDSWRVIQRPGNTSRSRLFGSWLATCVGTWKPEHGPLPGSENQRKSPSAEFPAVRLEYANNQGKRFWIPGTLTLQNLDDNRQITVETGQSDSEILAVMESSVLYRVNDTIYQARIAGNRLEEASVLVKDEDVPEVHWVFWSGAQ